MLKQLFNAGPIVPIITTARLKLRAVELDDKQFICDLEAKPELMTHIKEVQSPEQQIKFFESVLKPWQATEGEWLMLIAIDKQSKRRIGCFSMRIVSTSSLCAEIGYLVSLTEQGKGYAKEGALAVKESLFKQFNMHRVCAYCNTGNVASWKVMEQIGLAREGHLKQDFRLNNVWHDTYVYGQVRNP
ncbi:GNAT family N-acetyltransferase [Thalassotalea sp. ND16A]|uniref:GNAT family N-acetyltransferase n=1 Tax=Thalassotalea sp. ND16A TaxID=1535422 RepID=UPI00051A11B0|nr:GNAT family protein [Thalassotalea sp. ND16A]KGJ87516.1 hypothetical protein ND16A_2899 [Thalassotalea sp. ND16A]